MSTLYKIMDTKHISYGAVCKIVSAASTKDHVLVELLIPHYGGGVAFSRTFVRNDQLEQFEIKTESHCITKSKIIVINSVEDLLK